jgi:CheY-like chemotaxis protein
MTSSAPASAAEVLLVEDDPGDVLLTREAFEQHHLGLQLHVVGDGEEALRFLRRTGDFAGAPWPALVMLDLNLPRRSGLEVLGELKADPGLRTIPVVVLTTSQAEQDIQRSYQLHANAYVVKPFDADQFSDTIRQIDNFFLALVQQPAKGAPVPEENQSVAGLPLA